jgi:hypothetical protein
MSAITLHLPDELAERVRKRESRLAEILELGLRELDAGEQAGFEGAAEVLEFLAGLPSPEEILSLRPSVRLQRQIEILLEKSRTGELTPEEEKNRERYQFLEHLVRIAKTKALTKLETGSSSDV